MFSDSNNFLHFSLQFFFARCVSVASFFLVLCFYFLLGDAKGMLLGRLYLFHDCKPKESGKMLNNSNADQLKKRNIVFQEPSIEGKGRLRGKMKM